MIPRLIVGEYLSGNGYHGYVNDGGVYTTLIMPGLIRRP